MVPPPSQDPFYILRSDIQQQYNDIQKKVSRFHALTANNPERKQLAGGIENDCDSIKWQLNQLGDAIDKAAADPAKFNLTAEEVASRRKWLDTTARQVDGIKQALRSATASAPHVPTASDRVSAANDQFLGGEHQKQATIMKEQDHVLGDIEQSIDKIKQIGGLVKEHIEEDNHLLGELDQNVDTTTSRLKATQKKMLDIIKKSGSKTQLALIVFLIVVLVVLAVFAFY